MNIIDKYVLIIICHNLTDFNEKITNYIYLLNIFYYVILYYK